MVDKGVSKLRLALLELVYAGRTPSAIARDLRKEKSTISYHLKQLEADGLVAVNRLESEIEKRRWHLPNIKVYGLTDRGLQVLQNSKSRTFPSPGGEKVVRNNVSPRVEVHNFEVKLPIKRMGISWLPSVADLQNWSRKWDPDFHGVYLEATTKHVLLRARAEASTREIAEALCHRKLTRVQQLLENQYGCEFGHPEFRYIFAPGRSKIGVKGHELVHGLPAQNGELADIDVTPDPEGTIHPKDPNDADKIVMLARNATEIRELVGALTLSGVALNDAVRQLYEILKPPTMAPSSIDERRDVA